MCGNRENLFRLKTSPFTLNRVEKMFHKKKFTLVEKKKNEKKMYSAKNIKWVNYLIILALIGFVLLLVLANVKSKSYYQNLNASKKPSTENTSGTRSILSLDDISTRALDCSVSYCAVYCSGDMAGLKAHLNTLKSCSSYSLYISDYSFPDDRLQSNWLQGSFSLSHIEIAKGSLKGIDNGAFNQKTVEKVKELVLNGAELQNLTEDTFIGLNSLEKLILVNKIETFSGEGFIKPMVKTLKTLVVKHVTDIETDPGPWVNGGDFPALLSIQLDNSNLGGYIKATTFSHLKELSILSLKSCKINYIADGAFDFIMKQFVVFIDLRGNQLKHLHGNYLTKVGSLKSVDITLNPWDCNCELEDLIREYKRYHIGFGDNVTCSTPLKFAGQILNETVVERCEDTTTALTTLPTTTTITTSTSSSVTSPETTSPTVPSTTMTPDNTSSATSPETTLPTDPSTTTPQTPTGPTITPPTTTPPISTESPTSSSTSDLVTSPNTTTSASSLHPSDPTDSTTLTDNGITSSPPQTTPSPQNRTTTLSANTVFIECDRYSVSSKYTMEPPFFVELSPPDTHFDISRLSQTTAQLRIENPTDDLALIWFYDQPNTNGTGENIRIVGEFKIGCQSELEDSLLIEGLAQNRTYTFCLVKEGIQVISPFNCRSYCTSEEAVGLIDESEVWLKCKDKALTIGLFISGIIFSLCIGAIGMFLILRHHPVLLKGSKRVIIVNRSTGDVLIMPRPGGKSSLTESSYRDSFDTNTTVPQRRFSATSIQSGRSYMIANNYEDIEYRWKMNVVNDMIYANRVPKSPPPPLPKRTSQSISLTKDNVKKMNITVIQQMQKENDYGYIA